MENLNFSLNYPSSHLKELKNQFFIETTEAIPDGMTVGETIQVFFYVIYDPFIEKILTLSYLA